MSPTRSFVLIALSGVLMLFSVGRLAAAEPKPAGKDPSPAAQLVQQALDNEVAGDGDGRRKLLEQALAADSEYAPARWHRGQIWAGGTWLSAAESMAKSADDGLAAQYVTKRTETGEHVALELKLAQWCVKNGMPDRARLHFWRVVTNPKASEAQVKDAAGQLDLVSVGGMILTRQELKTEQEREKRIAEAIAKYRPILAQLQPAIDGEFGEKRDAAVAKLSAIDDPAVIPAIETCLSDHREGFGEELVRLLGRFPQMEPTQTLVRYAVVSSFLSVRERAIDELKKRPLHDYVPTLLTGLVAPIESKYRIQRDRTGNLHYEHMFLHENPSAKVVRKLDVDLVANVLRPDSRRTVRVPRGSPLQGVTILDNEDLFGLMEVDLFIKTHELRGNAEYLAAQRANNSAFDVLRGVTGHQIQNRPQDWWKWWTDYNQVHYPKPTYWQYARSKKQYLRYHSPIQFASMSCFRSGTPVWSEAGLRPIESIQPGDRVLSQDPDTGELSFKVVIGKTLRPPTEASQLTVNGEAITTTLGHPLWVTGKGWEMAKHVKEGDQLHGIGGIVNVNAIEPLPNKIEAHNLVVDDFNTYFVGNCGMLVHDNTYRKPTRAVVPGLVP